jgi:hypothetical protein
MRRRHIVFTAVMLFLFFVWVLALSEFAGTQDPANPPGSTSSYTLEDIYNRLTTGVDDGPGPFTEPTSGPGSTMYTLNEIMDKAPVADNANGATPVQVLTGRTYWGLRTSGGPWGKETGTMPIQTVDNTTVSQAAGYYNAFDLSTVDTDLASRNIKSGVNIFGVAGTSTNVPRTGQTGCWDQSGTSIPCAGTGQDGEYQLGSLPAVAPEGLKGFTDNGDGTVTDNSTGLIWLKNANCVIFFSGDITGHNWRNWSEALTAANSLTSGYCGLSDGSSAGDWRLPNANEIHSLMVDSGQLNPALPPLHPFTDVQLDVYHSSTTYAYDRTKAWGLNAPAGFLVHSPKTFNRYVWPVRNY